MVKRKTFEKICFTFAGSVPKTGLNKNCNMMGLEQDGGKQ